MSEILKRLKVAAYRHENGDPAEIEEIAEEIQRLTEAQRWIPVSERLPEDGDNVVATMNFEWYGCCKYQGFFPWVKPNWMANSDRQTSDPVTHWMPLPSPPKDTGGLGDE